MSRFYISVKDMLDSYGVEVNVFPHQDESKKPHYHYVGGIRIDDEQDETKAQPEVRNEPVVPFNSSSSFVTQLVAGGAIAQGDLLWISTAKYPKNTLVQVPSQGNLVYRVVDFSDYRGYSDAVIYVLKGDDKHPNGR